MSYFQRNPNNLRLSAYKIPRRYDLRIIGRILRQQNHCVPALLVTLKGGLVPVYPGGYDLAVIRAGLLADQHQSKI